MTPATRAEIAKATLAQDREEWRATWPSSESRKDTFPRSVTFRWLGAHLNPGAIAATAFTALFWRRPLLASLLRTFVTRR
jgi:hypothetical protein